MNKAFVLIPWIMVATVSNASSFEEASTGQIKHISLSFLPHFFYLKNGQWWQTH
jgi:hypothetical protein